MLSVAVEGASNVVEIGAFEGGGPALIRSFMAAGGTLTVVDPYPAGRLGFSAPLVTAKRVARGQRQVTTSWLRAVSLEAAVRWEGELDALVVDGIHTLDAVREDWSAWGRFVRPGGALVARNDVIDRPEWTALERGDALLAATTDDASWEISNSADSFTCFRRAAASIGRA